MFSHTIHINFILILQNLNPVFNIRVAHLIFRKIGPPAFHAEAGLGLRHSCGAGNTAQTGKIPHSLAAVHFFIAPHAGKVSIR